MKINEQSVNIYQSKQRKNMNKKLSLFALIALNIAFFGSIRNIPVVASVGYEAIGYMIAAVVLFALPISLVAAELATMWPDEEGGSQVWIKHALGDKWSFVASWLLWVQMFFGMVMISTAFAAVIPYIINKPELSTNNNYITVTIIITYWIITLINFKASFGKFISTYGSVIGVYIPAILLIVLGVHYAYVHGDVNLGGFAWSKTIPNVDSIPKLSFFAGMIFIFAGLEMASVHANDIENPRRNYPLSVFVALAALVVLNLVAGLSQANAIPADKISLDIIIQPFTVYLKEYNMPWLLNIIAACVAFGIFAQLNAWVLGPSKAMIKVAEDGLLPPFFQKRNKDGIPVTFVLIQASVITVLALLYVFVSAINAGFIMMLMLATILYCIVYVLILISEVVLRKTRPEMHRTAPVPGGKIGLFITVGLAAIGLIITMIVSFIPSSDIPKNLHSVSVIVQLIGLIVFTAIPLLVYKYKKPEWKKSN